MPSSCQEIRDMLADCLQNSDCVMVHGHTGDECLRPPLVDTLPTRCQQLKTGYGDCRRGWVDMRKRFRGNAPSSMSRELEGSGLPRQQLYGGTAGYGGVKPSGGGGGGGSSGEKGKEA